MRNSTHYRCTSIAQILPSRLDAPVVLPATQADRWVAKKFAASREIVPIRSRRARPSPLPKMRTKATDNDGGGHLCKGRKWVEIRPVGTISREVMRYSFIQGSFHCTTTNA